MFRRFIESKLLPTKEPSYLLIGETHIESSVTIGLANCSEELQKSSRPILYFTESLPRKKSKWLGLEQPYTIDEIRQFVKLNKIFLMDSEILAFEALIQSGVKIYGIENMQSAPPLYFKAETKRMLHQELKQSLPSFFKHPQFIKTMDEFYDLDGKDQALTLVQVHFAESDERIINANKEYINQMLKVSQKFKTPLCIFGGGAGHICEVRRITNNELVDKGMLKTMQAMELEADACYIQPPSHKQLEKEDKEILPSYTPPNSRQHVHGEISKCFGVSKQLTQTVAINHSHKKSAR